MKGFVLRILLANSDQDFIENFKYSFKSEEYQITSTNNIADTIYTLKEKNFDLAIIDMNYKDGTGLDLKRKMNEIVNIPTIVVSDKHEPNEVVLALEYGCDDYITRPFYLLELKARIRSVLRRSLPNRQEPKKQEKNQNSLVKGRFEFNMVGRKVRVDTIDIELTGKEFDLLYVLVTNKKTIFSRKDLAEKLWNGLNDSNIRTVDVHIRRLREKLSRTNTDKYIQTSWGEGYFFDDDHYKTRIDYDK